MLSRPEIRRKLRDIIGEGKIDEGSEVLPAMLVLKRGSIRVLADGKRVAEYSHDSGFTVIFPMMFSNGKRS